MARFMVYRPHFECGRFKFRVERLDDPNCQILLTRVLDNKPINTPRASIASG